MARRSGPVVQFGLVSRLACVLLLALPLTGVVVASAPTAYAAGAPAAPTFTSSPPPQGNSRSPSWTVQPDPAASPTAITRCRTVQVAAVTRQVTAWSVCAGPTQADLTSEPDGTYQLEAYTDDAGTLSTVAASSTYTLDTVAPRTPAFSRTPVSPGNDPAPSWAFSSDADATTTCSFSVDGQAQPTDPCTSTASISLTGRSQANVILQVVSTDTARNTATATSTYSFDAVPPPAPTFTAAPPAAGNVSTVRWSFTAESGSVTACRETATSSPPGNWAACTSPYSWTVGPANGTYTLEVRATDAAGNVGPAALGSYRYDTDPPPAPVVTPPTSPSSDSRPAVTVVAETGAVLACRTTAPDGSTTTTRCTSPWYPQLGPDGRYQFEVTATDEAGNVGPPGYAAYTLDTTPPFPPQVQPEPSPSRNLRPAWSWTAQPGDTAECTLTGPNGRTTAPVACASPWAENLADGDGTYTASVRLRDSAGNVSPSGQASYTLDTTPPTTPVVTVGPSPSNDVRPRFSWSGEPASQSRCALDTPSGSRPEAPCASPYDVDLAGAPDGSYVLRVVLVDAAGNVSAVGKAAYQLDTTPPAAPRVDSAPPSPGNSRSVVWEVSGEPESVLACRLLRNGAEVQPWGSCTSPVRLTLDGPDGSYRLELRSSDRAGNIGPVASSTYELDTTAPAAPSFATQPATPGNDATPTWTITTESGSTPRCSLNDDANHTLLTERVCTSTYTIDLTGQPDGTYHLVVVAEDAAGNRSPSVSSAYQLDRVPPPAPQVVRREPTPGRQRSFTIDIAAEAKATLHCLVSGPDGWSRAVDPCPAAASFDLGSGSDGIYVAAVTAEDAAGNVSDPTEVVYELDTTAPAAPLLTAIPGSPSSSPGPSWSFTGEQDAQATCRVLLVRQVVVDWTACTSPYTADLRRQVDGRYTVQFRLTDRAGNTSAVTAADYQLDREAPVGVTITPPDPNPSDSRSPVWFFRADGAVDYQCQLSRGRAVLQGWTYCASPLRVDLTGLPDGVVTLQVRAIDAAGNTSAASASTYTLDTSRPAAIAFTSSPPPRGTTRAPTWGWQTPPSGVTTTCRWFYEGQLQGTPQACTAGFTGALQGKPDGQFTLEVVPTSMSGVTGPSTRGSYLLDTTGPAAPAVAGSGPTWTFTMEAGATATCLVSRDGAVTAEITGCSSPFTLTPARPGSYTVSVWGVDEVGNKGDVATVAYVVPTTVDGRPAPTTGGPTRSATPADPFTFPSPLEPAPRPVGPVLELPPPPTSIRPFPLPVVGPALALPPAVPGRIPGGASPHPAAPLPDSATPRAGLPGRPSVAAGRQDLVGPVLPPVGLSGPNPTSAARNGSAEQRPGVAPPPQASASPALAAPANGPAAAVTAAVEAAAGAPAVLGTVAVKAVERPQFPLALLIVVGVFLLVQDRIDRRDPKLSLVRAAADDSGDSVELPFGAPVRKGGGA